jgi:hypothetical protein
MISQERATSGFERMNRLQPAFDNFENVFQIPLAHTLVLVRSRSREGQVQETNLHHREYDGKGALIAEYESFEKIDETGQVQSGWRRYNVKAGQRRA